MTSALHGLRRLLAAGWFACAAASLAASEAGDRLRELAQERPGVAASARALAWIRQHTRADGRVDAPAAVAVTALAIKAHLAAGDGFAGERGPWLRRSLAAVLAAADPSGSFASADGGRMYTHGIVALTLAESLGEIGDAALERRCRAGLERGVALILRASAVAKAPGHRGGWRYSIGDEASDLSVTAWQVQALLAARSAGIAVDPAVLAAAGAYARGLIAADGRVGYDAPPGNDHPALRGSALVVLAAPLAATAAAGDPLLARIAGRVRADPIAWGGEWFFYRCYTDALAARFSDEAAWQRHARHVEALLCAQQSADGSWPVPPGGNEDGHGAAYRTAMAVLALSAERQFLPSFRR